MDLGYKFGQMELDMKDIGKIIRLMDVESSGMFMETSMRDNGKEIRLMDMASTYTVMEPLTKDSGSMTCNTEEERNTGMTVRSTMESTTRARSMGEVVISGKMGLSTQESGI
jgi:hypothetical protein